MPRFELVSMSEATLSLATGSSATGKRAEIIREYGGYIGQLGPNQAGKLTPDEGESVATVRRRVVAAAKLVNRDLVISRGGEVVFFWSAPKRRRRPRKT